MGTGNAVKNTLDELLRALCADYERRRRLIEGREMPRRVDMELRYLNFKIYDATAEIVGEGAADMFIKEIGSGVGYAKSEIDNLSETTYKDLKRLARQNIAKRLYLID